MIDLDLCLIWLRMKTPSLLVQCLPGLGMSSKGSHGAMTVYDSDLHLISPAVEIVPPKVMKDVEYVVKARFCDGYMFMGKI